ncbi:MAG: UDP-N-acetylmuramoyl-L-alanyl-D-glutamate--2,6-diaminopimelate ligase [Candidatus Saccharimonadales bacterium]
MPNLRKIVKKALPKNIFRAIEPTGHLAEAVISNISQGFPAQSMRIIGVTGTNGKTTTSFMIHKMLVDAGYKTALMTTVAYGVNNDVKSQIAHMTTVSSLPLQKRLREFKNQGVDWVVLETTSHALAQHRVWGVPYEIAVMTNITHEHLDYHGTFARYVEAKVRLFKIAGRHGYKFGVVNADDPSAKKFIDAIPESTTYGLKSGDLLAENVLLEPDGCRYSVRIGEDHYNIHCRIPGEFNVYNSLAAVAVGRKLGLSVSQIERGIAALEGVEGRMTVVSAGQVFNVVVDFAHTPDSFERLLRDLRTATKGKLIVVFGSAGRRDEVKRAIQGEIAGKYGDEVILTEEDDRDIDGNLILGQIASGAEKSGKTIGKDLFLELDRTKAIEFAMTRAGDKTDIVILLGKGHEKTIERIDGEHPWNEVATAKAAIKKLEQ